VRDHEVSDVHGSVDALAQAADGADALVCLGDLVLFLDYHDTSGGIFAEMFAVLPDPTYLTYGNVDVPKLWNDHLPPHASVFDGETTVIGGRTWGFVGGGLRTPMNTPYEIDDDVYAEKVAALGPVDVLACHIPPDIPELLYDVAARRFERGSSAVLDAIRDTRPELVLFGHVHQPLVQRTRIGRTELVNVGHFAGTGTPYVVEY
jgi:Icc-related predicted phosphoesterase